MYRLPTNQSSPIAAALYCVMVATGSTAFAAVVLLSTTVSAQESVVSDPVLASEADEDTTDDDPGAPVEERRRAPVLRRPIYEAGNLTVGLDGAFSMTRSRVELLDEDVDEAIDTTRFFRLDPSVTIGVVERFDLGLLTGIVQRRLAREGADSTTDTALAIQPIGRFFMPVSRTIAIYTEAAPGYFRGSAERIVPDPDDEEADFDSDEIEPVDTRTRGFLLTLGTGINYRLSEGMQLRFGLSFDGMWGRESIEEIDDRLSTSTTNLGTRAGIHYTF